MDKQNIIRALEFLDPAPLLYQEWVNVGMALQYEGYTASVWEEWSKKDSARYHPGECFQKWGSFQGSSTPVTGGTIIQLAKEQGWGFPSESYELDWDSVIGTREEMVVVNKNWVEGQDVTEPESWNSVSHLIEYLETLFKPNEHVGYCCQSFKRESDNKIMPTKGLWDRTASQLIKELQHCNGDIGSVLGDYKEEVGAWIRFNPLDGQGCRDINVTAYRYALVESDHMDLEKQHAIIRELELPVAALVHSGKKSIHAIVKIDAETYEEYRKRVDFLYEICAKNGLKVDPQNRNPSRYSRMPGVMRNGQKQFLIDTNIGKDSWNAWKEWIEGINDDLPEPESMASVWDNLPKLSPPLINGLLRQGHKMLLAGPSKAGKSYALIQLCCAIAEGKKWFGWDCTQGKIMYVNLELDRASCLHRFKDVYQALKWEPKNTGNIDIWNLRGKSVPMDKLAPKLIRRAHKKKYLAIIIDPIYKVITGDENSADQMAHFCNQFDKVCSELGAAVIYCHHHSKGSQGSKRSMDRASGSGVFARDPDALLDLIELDVTEAILKQEQNKAVCKVCENWLTKKGLISEASQDDLCSESAMLEICKRLFEPAIFAYMMSDVKAARLVVQKKTAWRIEGTLREFPKFDPVNLWFDYPIHSTENVETLKDAGTHGERPPWQKAIEKRKPKEKKSKERKESIEIAFGACGLNGEVMISDLAEYMGVSEKTVRNRLKEHGGFEIDVSVVKKKT
jgi:RecA-family ATPase